MRETTCVYQHCGKSCVSGIFQTASRQLQKHQSHHCPELFTCKHCGNGFASGMFETSAQKQQDHHARHCPKLFSCKHCCQDFESNSSSTAAKQLEEHQEHHCERLFSCQHCGKSCVSGIFQTAARQLQKHQSHHCPELFICKQCGKGFTSGMFETAVQKLQKHQETGCTCDVCNQVLRPMHDPHGNLLVSPQEQLKLCCKTVTMYHGTNSAAADQIMCAGFRPSVDGMLGRGVYASRDIRKAQRYGGGQALLELSVDVGKVACITCQGHPMQKAWRQKGYDSAWVPANCGMVHSGLEESCIQDPSRIRVVRRHR